MYPYIENEWYGVKNEPVEEPSPVGNVSRSWQWRERGTDPPNYPPNKKVFENIAEDILVQKPLQIRSCDLPGYPRSTFLMVFSPDGTKVASTHGNHNVYVSELASGKHVRILKGHPRTPWCIAFHPSHPQLIGSGCLGGQVRVWDIASGGSEVWNVRNETVIASIAFHPREQLLVIATYNELYFWDWSQPAPFTKVSTNNVNEKVRFVAFDSLGYKLITGISLWASAVNANSNPLSTSSSSSSGPSSNGGNGGSGNTDDTRPPESPGAAQDMIVNSYQTLVQRYDSLVRNYQRLFMVRHRLTNTPPPPNTIDRGTDPMETYPMDLGRRRRASRRSSRTSTNDSTNPSPSTSRRQDGADSGDGESSSSRFLNLDVLSFNSDASRTQDSPSQERSPFGSRSSAFQPLNDSVRSFRTVDQSERTRLLPNPFSSRSGTTPPRPSIPAPRSRRFPLERSDSSTDLHSSRTSIFTSSRSDSSLGREFGLRRRNSPAAQSSPLGPSPTPPPPADPAPSTSGPTTTNSSTQMSPDADNVDAQTINESLDLIRDILRDSGTRLLNLITSMSMNLMSERSEGGERGGTRRRPRMRMFTDNLRRDLFPSSSDSDSDPDILRFLRSTSSAFREPGAPPAAASEPPVSRAPSDRLASRAASDGPTDRMVFELDDVVSPSSSRFRVRTQNSSVTEGPVLADESEQRAGTSERRAQASEPRIVTSETLAGTSEPHAETSVPCVGTSQTCAGPSEPRPQTFEPIAGTSKQYAGTSDLPPETFEPRAEPSGLRVGASKPNSETTEPRAGTSQPSAETSEPRAGTSEPRVEKSEPRPRTDLGFDPNMPSTSRDNFWSRGPEMPPAEAYRRVRSGVSALQKHTLELAHTWLRGERLTMKQLRTMWENLRRRILALHRETRQESPGYYTRSLLERCIILTEMTDMASRHNTRSIRNPSRLEENQRNTQENATNSENVSSSNTTVEAGTSRVQSTTDNRPYSRPAILRSSRSSAGSRASPLFRRRLQSAYRWQSGDGLRRARVQPRLVPRHTRRDFARAFEISTTRHEIRMRAMQVLSVMFNMMMMCLGERGLSQVIMHMLKALKKALALSCFMMMSTRSNPTRSSTNATPPSQSVESMDVVRIQNAEHTGPVNVDGPDDPASPRVNPPNEDRTENGSGERNNASIPPVTNKPSTSTQSAAMERDTQTNDLPATSPGSDSQKWSHRLAVQIAAANRNNSTTARTRRELYLECKRQKALHRTNPAAHPFIRRRFPPVSTHRIPALRRLPLRGTLSRVTPRGPPPNDEPVAGPSNAPQESANRDSPRGEMNDFDNRVNLIRIAHMQAVRLRNAARNRFRRLQTIRLYTPSSVFALASNANENQQDNRTSPQNNTESNRRPFVSYGPHVMSPRGEAAGRPNESAQFHAVLNNVAMPLMQVNDLPPTLEAQGGQSQRLPRIHEYLQPIILAQNAMVVEDDGDGGAPGGGGGAGGGSIGRRMGGISGLLDAGIISEALPAPSNRVQAWDFTTGQTPEIADSTKNVVVQRCRIHNDASIDISKDGRLLVALLPGSRLRHTNSWLGVYSLEWARLGQCLHTAMLEQSAVSVALSPTARYLAVGLGSRRFSSAPHSRTNIIALLYKLDPLENSSRTGLTPIKELMQHWEHGFTSLNCLRWAPQPGQGLVYANNTGQLIIMS